MSKIVTVVDYGLGNLFSVRRAFEYNGAEVHFTSQPQEILEASMLVLPGVGAFEQGMNELRNKNLIEPLKIYAESGRPMLSICLGMQLLMSYSLEFGKHEGLGMISGKVVPIETKKDNHVPLKVPHVGWNALKKPKNLLNNSWQDTILVGLTEETKMYFVHSYAVVPDKEENRLANISYGWQDISAVIRKGNIYGCQFHPEKSGTEGLKIIKNFLDVA